MVGWHIVISSKGRAQLFPTEAVRRPCVHILGRIVGERATLFNLVDDHVHVIVSQRDRKLAGRTRHALVLSLKPRVAVPMQAALLDETVASQLLYQL